MAKSSATKEKKNGGSSSSLDQNAIRRAAKARRKNNSKSNRPAVEQFTIRAVKQDRKARQLELREQRATGFLVNECINAVFAGADRTGLCILYSHEEQKQVVGMTDTDTGLPVPVKFSDAVRSQAQHEIMDWCEKNPGKYECKLNSSGSELALANLMFVKKG